MSNQIPPVNHDVSEPWWGLKPGVTPCFGARLVQEGNRLHYLADRASIVGTLSDVDIRHLEQAFPMRNLSNQCSSYPATQKMMEVQQ